MSSGDMAGSGTWYDPNINMVKAKKLTKQLYKVWKKDVEPSNESAK